MPQDNCQQSMNDNLAFINKERERERVNNEKCKLNIKLLIYNMFGLDK